MELSPATGKPILWFKRKGFELGRRGFFSGEEKERKRQRTGVNIAIITSIASAIIAIIAIVADYLK